MFRFIHAADVHLDSPLKGLERYEGAPVTAIQDAARRALENLVHTAIDQRVAFVLLSGDIYDGDWRDYNTGLFFTRQASRLREAGIPLLMIAGNHDAANRMTRSLRLPDNVTLFPADEPGTVRLEELDVAIHGQSFASAAVHEDLSQGYPAAIAGMFNIGLLHTCATGREGHEPYAPCTLDGLRLKGYDYWALGHIHHREVLSEQPFIAFPGNLQGRHIRESGAKGCLLGTVGDDRSLKVAFQALDVLRWERLVADVSESRSTDAILDLVAGELENLHGEAAGRPLAVRVELVGATTAHRPLLARKHHWANEIRSRALDVARGDIWIEKLKFHTSDPAQTSKTVRPAKDAIGELRALFAAARSDQKVLDDVKFDLTDVAKKLPPELKDRLRTDDPQWLRSVLDEAESRLLNQLLDAEQDA
jgi:DNA repair exonuclease SbcCD nuclease subunit